MVDFINLSQFDSLAAASSAAISRLSGDLEGKGGGITITVGTAQPNDKSVWLDITDYTGSNT